MNEIKVSLDKVGFTSKPDGSEAAQISVRIGRNTESLKCPVSVYEFAYKVGACGCTFSPATFLNGSRKTENFEQMQMMVLDFDGGITYEDVRDRAKQYGLPMFSAYETFSSKDGNRFRIIFLNDVPITDSKAAKIYKDALMEIFPESDPTDIDVSKMYYGGKGVLYLNQSLPTIDMDSVLKNMVYYLKKRRGDSHYKDYVKKFAKKHGIRLNKKGLLDISAVNSPTESASTSDVGKNLLNPIIFYKSNGEFLPPACYQIHLTEECTESSVEGNKIMVQKTEESSALKDVRCKCQLFREFESGKRRLHHHELFGLSTNIIYIKTGRELFKDILQKYPDYYDSAKIERWEFYLKYNKESNYSPEQCSRFCAYSGICDHGMSILSTAKPKRGTMEKLDSYTESYYPIEEVHKDLKRKLEDAVSADDRMWHIIKAQTAAGKTEAYLTLMKAMHKRFLIAVPTNKLKQDVKGRAGKMGINIMATPSLDEIKDEIPEYIWEHIQSLRNTGRHAEVHTFVSRMAEEEGIKCLKKYLREQKEFENHSGHAITTHRKLLNMDKTALRKYDAVIIDEDIILSSIIPNQCEIPVPLLRRILKKAVKENTENNYNKGSYDELVKKIKRMLHMAGKGKLFRLPGFEWDDGKDGDAEEDKKEEIEITDGISALTDIPSLCLAEAFMCRKASDERNPAEDSIVFLKPYKFKNIKYIMVSATVDRDICEYCFGKQNVDFQECKQARYMGTLNQYYDKSMSRSSIDEDPNILKRISEWSGFRHMITFKKYKVGDMYFGNAIGCDYLKGQNIDVVGTPYQVDFLYKLFPYTLGIEVDGDAEMKPHVVTHNGYRFVFNTYGEEHGILRKFHFWMIESELEQAIGRARLLRCDCTVNLFSNFPVRQAAMKKSEYEKKKEDTL